MLFTSYFCLALALLAIAVAAYGRFEVYPAYTAATARHVDDSSSTLVDSLHSTLTFITWAGLALGVISIILGVWSFWRLRYAHSVVGVVFGVGAVVLALMDQP